MLVLSRRLNEAIVLPGLGITIQLLDIKSIDVARIGIDVPAGVQVVLKELLDKLPGTVDAGRQARQLGPS
jgi:carbon storage regulator CsrA